MRVFCDLLIVIGAATISGAFAVLFGKMISKHHQEYRHAYKPQLSIEWHLETLRDGVWNTAAVFLTLDQVLKQQEARLAFNVPCRVVECRRTLERLELLPLLG